MAQAQPCVDFFCGGGKQSGDGQTIFEAKLIDRSGTTEPVATVTTKETATIVGWQPGSRRRKSLPASSLQYIRSEATFISQLENIPFVVVKKEKLRQHRTKVASNGQDLQEEAGQGGACVKKVRHGQRRYYIHTAPRKEIVGSKHSAARESIFFCSCMDVDICLRFVVSVEPQDLCTLL